MTSTFNGQFDSMAKATCQSSNKLGYTLGSAKDSAAFGLTFMQSKLEAKKQERSFQMVSTNKSTEKNKRLPH